MPSSNSSYHDRTENLYVLAYGTRETMCSGISAESQGEKPSQSSKTRCSKTGVSFCSEQTTPTSLPSPSNSKYVDFELGTDGRHRWRRLLVTNMMIPEVPQNGFCESCVIFSRPLREKVKENVVLQIESKPVDMDVDLTSSCCSSSFDSMFNCSNAFLRTTSFLLILVHTYITR